MAGPFIFVLGLRSWNNEVSLQVSLECFNSITWPNFFRQAIPCQRPIHFECTLAESAMLEFWNLQGMFFIGSYGLSFAFWRDDHFLDGGRCLAMKSSEDDQQCAVCFTQLFLITTINILWHHNVWQILIKIASLYNINLLYTIWKDTYAPSILNEIIVSYQPSPA